MWSLVLRTGLPADELCMPTHTMSCRLSPEITHTLNHRTRISQRPVSQLIEAALHYYNQNPHLASTPPPQPEPGTTRGETLGPPRKVRLSDSAHRILIKAAETHECSPSHIIRYSLRTWMSMTTPDTLGNLGTPDAHTAGKE